MVKVGVVISVISYQLSVISYHSDLSNIVTVITVGRVEERNPTPNRQICLNRRSLFWLSRYSLLGFPLSTQP